MNGTMASERTRVLAIVAIVALVAGGAGFYFVKIYRPKQLREGAQAEVNDWDARWKAARACLLGPKPGSSKTAEALAVREMSPDPWNRGSCTPLMGKLTRGDAPQSGIDDVEKAWAELETAAGHAASAFATHVAESTIRLDDPLPVALDMLFGVRTGRTVPHSPWRLVRYAGDHAQRHPNRDSRRSASRHRVLRLPSIGSQRGLGGALAQRAHTQAMPCAAAGTSASDSGAIVASKHQQCAAFGSAAIAQAFASPQSGQRLGSTDAPTSAMRVAP